MAEEARVVKDRLINHQLQGVSKNVYSWKIFPKLQAQNLPKFAKIFS
jgi:hypothetical protein